MSTNRSDDFEKRLSLDTAPTRPVKKVPTPLRYDCVWVEGELLPYEEAAVHMLSPSLHYGAGIFEGIRCHNTDRGPAIFRLEAHLRRFMESARRLGVHDLQWTLADLRRAVCATVQANSYQACYVRPALFFAGGIALEEERYTPRLSISAWPWDPAPDSGGESGVRVTLAPPGYLAEWPGESLFVVLDGMLHTPPRPSSQEEIMRHTVMMLARDLGHTIVEKKISRAQLFDADEIFLCGTAAGVVPIREIDRQIVGGGVTGPITSEIQSLYAETVRGHGARSAGWLEYVMTEPLF